jgi:hypothetical protein
MLNVWTVKCLEMSRFGAGPAGKCQGLGAGPAEYSVRVISFEAKKLGCEIPHAAGLNHEAHLSLRRCLVNGRARYNAARSWRQPLLREVFDLTRRRTQGAQNKGFHGGRALITPSDLGRIRGDG